MLAMVAESEGWTGPEGSPSKVTHSCVWRVSAGSCQEDSVPHNVDFSTGLLMGPGSFPQKE